MKFVSTVVVVILLATTLACSAKKEEVTGFKPDANLTRTEVPDQYKWDTSFLFKSDEAWETEYNAVRQDFPKLATFKGKLASPESIKECLDLYFSLHKRAATLNQYAQITGSINQGNNKYTEMVDKGTSLMKDLMEESSFIRQEILAQDPETIKNAYTAGVLKPYTPYISEMMRRRDRVKSPDEEKLLAAAGDNLWAEIDLNELPSNFEKSDQAMLTDLKFPMIKDEDGKDVQLSLSNYPKYRRSPDREVRKTAVENFFATLKQFKDVFASLLSGQYQFSIFLAGARDYARAIDAYMDKDNIDTKVYDNLIETTHKNIDKFHRYIELRKKLLGVESVHYYDLYAPLIKSMKKEFTFDEARDDITKALAPLGKDYISTLEKGMDPKNGWFDLYPHKDKDSGAYCSASYGNHPVVFLNFFGNYDDLSTMAHEFGHALHYNYSISAQPYWTFNAKPFLSEIASTVNEILLNQYMIDNAKTKDEKLFYLINLLERIKGTIFRQTQFAEFEKLMHEMAEKGQPISADSADKTYADLVKFYYGDKFVAGENEDIEWAYIPHFYYKFYVYSYATGMSSAIAIVDEINKGKPDAAKNYINMLKGGASKPPLELLKGAGVDLTTPEPVQAAFDLFGETLDKIDKLLAEK